MKNYATSATFGAPLTAERLRQVLSLDRATWTFSWAENGRGRFKRKGAAAGRISKYGYWTIAIDGRWYMAHRLVWLWVHGSWPQHEIDHKDGNRLNNNPENLRDVPHAINAQNIRRARRDNKSAGVLGVSVGSDGRARASVHLDGKQVYLGSFDSVEDAHSAYLRAKRQLHVGCTI